MRNPIISILLLLGFSLFLAGCSDDPVDPAPGDQFTTRTIYSSEYLNNRFFRLDLPEDEFRGRVGGEVIDVASIRVHQKMGSGTPTPEEISNVAVYVDSTGWRDWEGIDFTQPFDYGSRWRQITDFSIWRDVNGGLVALDMGKDMGAETVLAVTYDVLDARGGTVIGGVGDNPETAQPAQVIMDAPPDQLYYRMKLLKARANLPDAHVFKYILRNVYFMGSTNIDPSGFDLRIEENDQSNDRPNLDEQGYDYFRIFGLDMENVQGDPGADGVVDYHNAVIFDLARGLLKFPLDFPQPFAATPDQYEANVPSGDWVWDEDSFLANNLTPEIYDMNVLPNYYPEYQKFKIVVTTRDCLP